MATTDRTGQMAVNLAVLCALLTTGIAIKGEFLDPKTPGRAVPTKPTAVPDWPSLMSTGHRMGPANATVTIVEFADFECPACRRFATSVIPVVRKAYPAEVAVVFRNWPLPYHKSALPAAIAAECAAVQGRFEAMHDILYAKQDSLKSLSMLQFARRAGVTDTAAFLRCTSRDEPMSIIAADTLAVRALQGKGTPTVIINGMLWPGVPDSASIDEAVQTARKSTGTR